MARKHYYRFPIFAVPVYMLLAGPLELVEKLSPPYSSYTLNKSLSSLKIHLECNVHSPWLLWMLTQAHAQSSVTSLVVTARINHKDDDELFQRFLATMHSLRHLKILVLEFLLPLNSTLVPSLTFKTEQALESLEIHNLSCNHKPLMWIPWLWNVLHAFPSSRLAVVRIVIYIGIQNPELDLRTFTRGSVLSSDIELGDIDNYLCDLPHLQELCFSLRLGNEPQEVTEDVVERWMKRAFWRCDAKNILKIKMGNIPLLDEFRH